ncbi:MAG: hypothetical protein QOD54_1057 [Sphingomonadales bacterium]|jgi:hypothetical protein|nr:hypothetical protein [Sphingomonadales bacterium]
MVASNIRRLCQSGHRLQMIANPTSSANSMSVVKTPTINEAATGPCDGKSRRAP